MRKQIIENSMLPLPLLQNNVKQTVYTYDANDSQINDKTEINTYNVSNKLISFTYRETISSGKYESNNSK